LNVNYITIDFVAARIWRSLGNTGDKFWKNFEKSGPTKSH